MPSLEGSCRRKVQVIEAHTHIGQEDDRLVGTAWKRNGCWIIQAMDQRVRTMMLRSPLLDDPMRVTTEATCRMSYEVVRSRQQAEHWLKANMPPGTTLWSQDPAGTPDLLPL